MNNNRQLPKLIKHLDCNIELLLLGWLSEIRVKNQEADEVDRSNPNSFFARESDCRSAKKNVFNFILSCICYLLKCYGCAASGIITTR